MVLAGNDRFEEMRAFYQGDARLRVPPVISTTRPPKHDQSFEWALADEPGIALDMV
jgi:hypothetical protein